MRRKRKLLPPGQSLVEFALLLPFFLLIVMGIFDLGRVVFYYSTMTNAAREGARFGVVNPDNLSGITAEVCRFEIGVDLGCPNPPVENLRVLTVDDNYIEVRVTLKISLITPVLRSFFKLDDTDRITINTRSRMRIEG